MKIEEFKKLQPKKVYIFYYIAWTDDGPAICTTVKPKERLGRKKLYEVLFMNKTSAIKAEREAYERYLETIKDRLKHLELLEKELKGNG